MGCDMSINLSSSQTYYQLSEAINQENNKIIEEVFFGRVTNISNHQLQSNIFEDNNLISESNGCCILMLRDILSYLPNYSKLISNLPMDFKFKTKKDNVIELYEAAYTNNSKKYIKEREVFNTINDIYNEK